jgi:Gpi18-like mannosyltransferase
MIALILFLIITVMGILADKKLFSKEKIHIRIIYFAVIAVSLALFCMAEFSDFCLSKYILP